MLEQVPSERRTRIHWAANQFIDINGYKPMVQFHL
jgi:hypothetical protein